MTANKIRQDLKDIRYYFARQSVFDKTLEKIGQHSINEKINFYNEAIRFASPRLYDLYVSLYIDNHTQESLSEKLGYAMETISRLHSKLINFFMNYYKEKEGVGNV